ncbi:MAG TPA: trehalose-6-phosphate synthase [Actinomycetota bacterium]|nr:trehalose-6-phosphate synthase [Actinomycetota bacterium]
MRDDTTIVLVSNRGPVSFVETPGGFETKRGAGGLAGALDPVARRLGDRAVWVAATTSDADRKAVASGAADGIAQQLGYELYLLDVEADTYSRYYDVVSNRMLWFANHCLWDELNVKTFGAEELAAWEDAYQPVNRRFASAVAEVAGRSGLVLFQDYHLSTAPAELRRIRPDQTIFHFTHSSFCGPEDGLERVPRPIPQTVIEGLMGADLVGFHVAQWVHNFLDCCERIGADVDRDDGLVRHEGVDTWVREYPIPIDPTDLRERAREDPASTWADRFRHDTVGPLVVRADRSEPSKNVIRGFEAFGMLLDRRPDLAATARFVACLYPSRQSMPEYRRYAEDVERVVAEVNARHPGAIDLYMKDDFDRTLGAYRVYDVLLVNPIMDGMNLVAKEGPCLNENDGVLVLSPGAGSFEELGEHAVAIEDQMDVSATAAALERAIDMPREERRRRADELRSVSTARKPEDWINAQLDDLEAVRDGRAPLSPPAPAPRG